MTLKEIKKHYRIRKMDGYYDLYTLKVDKSSRCVYKYICTIYKTPTHKFHIKGCEPVSKFELLQKQIEDYLNSLEYDSEYYCPSYRKGTAQDWFLVDLLGKYGFKRGGYREPEGFRLKRDTVYGTENTILTVDFKIDNHKEIVSIYLRTGEYSWVTVTTSFDLMEIHKNLDALLKPYLLTEGIQNITLSEKMEMSDVELTLLKLKGFDSNLTKIDLKRKLLELAETL